MKKHLISHLREHERLRPLVGGHFFINAPKPDETTGRPHPLPYVVIRRVTRQIIRDQDGPTGERIERYQFDCLAESPANAEAIAAAIEDVFDGHRGRVGALLDVQCEVQDTTDDFSAPEDASETGDYVVISEVEFIYKRDA